MADQTVYVAAGTDGDNEVYHTERDCKYLRRADAVREFGDNNVSTKRKCRECSGKAIDTGGSDDLHDLLLEVDSL